MIIVTELECWQAVLHEKILLANGGCQQIQISSNLINTIKLNKN